MFDAWLAMTWMYDVSLITLLEIHLHFSLFDDRLFSSIIYLSTFLLSYIIMFVCFSTVYCCVHLFQHFFVY